jgi:hypothetical protein
MSFLVIAFRFWIVAIVAAPHQLELVKLERRESEGFQPPLVLFSQTIFAIVRGFAKPLLGILRTSLGVAPADARSVES